MDNIENRNNVACQQADISPVAVRRKVVRIKSEAA